MRDSSATFYNPGALALIEDPTLSVSGNAYGAQVFAIENGAGADDLVSIDYVSIPTMVAGVWHLGAEGQHAVGYTLLTRAHLDLQATSRVQRVFDALRNAAGPEQFTGQLDVSVAVDETWAGLSYAHRITPWLSAGATLFGAVRSNTITELRRAEAFNATTSAFGQSTQYARFDFLQLALLAKIGLVAEFGGFSVGATWQWSEHWAAFSSLRSDRSTGPDDGDGSVTVANWSLVHFTLGCAVRSKHSELGVGIGLTGGGHHTQQPVNFGNATEADLLFGTAAQAEVGYATAWLFLGYTYFF